MNESINQSINQSVNESMNEWICQGINECYSSGIKVDRRDAELDG